MAVVLSMLTLVPGGMGGSETYGRELVHELAGRPLDVSVVVAPPAAGFGAPLPERVAVGYRGGSSSRDRTAGLALGLTVQRRALARLTAGAHVVHHPFTVAVPPARRGQRSVVTLLDVQHHDLPHLFSRAERAYRAWAYDRAARRADVVVTISEFCRGRIVHHLGIDPGKVRVAPLGVRADEFRAQTGAREPFLLYPAKGWPHKDHATLLRAFVLLRRARPGLRLVLTGATRAELPQVPDGVEVRGLVPRAELVELYRSAAALVFPSTYEGFGLPVLEAMASGCPVAAAAAGSLPEVVGDAGVLFRPGDPEDCARGVLEALDRSAELQERGLAAAGGRGWQRCGDVHAEVYEALGG